MQRPPTLKLNYNESTTPGTRTVAQACGASNLISARAKYHHTNTAAMCTGYNLHEPWCNLSCGCSIGTNPSLQLDVKQAYAVSGCVSIRPVAHSFSGSAQQPLDSYSGMQISVWYGPRFKQLPHAQTGSSDGQHQLLQVGGSARTRNASACERRPRDLTLNAPFRCASTSSTVLRTGLNLPRCKFGEGPFVHVSTERDGCEWR
jgi:hypothetical protein